MSGGQPVSAREIYLTHDDRLDDARRGAWVTWLTRHGIDPWMVALPGPIICEDGDLDRCVWFDAFHKDAEGRIGHLASVCPDIHSPTAIPSRDDDFCTVRTKVQLEGRALPFPDFATPKEMMHP